MPACPWGRKTNIYIYISKKRSTGQFFGRFTRNPWKKREMNHLNQSHPFSERMLVFRFGRQERPALASGIFLRFLEGQFRSRNIGRVMYVFRLRDNYAKRQCFWGDLSSPQQLEQAFTLPKTERHSSPLKMGLRKRPKDQFSGAKIFFFRDGHLKGLYLVSLFSGPG